MDVLVTGAYGRCGTALIDHLSEKSGYHFSYLNRSDRPADHEYGGYETIVGNVADFDVVRTAFDDKDAVIHLAAYPYADGSWDDVEDPNIQGMYNVLEAARQAEVESIVFGSTNHVMGGYEEENAPYIYYPGHGISLDYTDPIRPDSYYGVTKAFGEALGRHYVENYEYPKQFYAIRICAVRMPEYDHPYGDAERQVDEGEIEPDDAEYNKQAARMKAMWQSRRDFAHQVECCLQDDAVEFGIFSGVSDNHRRWYSIEHARSVIGYSPQDNGETWDSPSG